MFLIKKKPPKSCDSCPFKVLDYYRAYTKCSISGKALYFEDTTKRAKNCPIIDVIKDKETGMYKEKKDEN